MFSLQMNYNRLHVNDGEVDGSTSPKRTSAQVTSHTMSPSFLEPDILKHLCRELDRDKVETEFSIKVDADLLFRPIKIFSINNLIVLETNRLRRSVTGERRCIYFARISSNKCQSIGGKHSSDILPSSGAI